MRTILPLARVFVLGNSNPGKKRQVHYDKHENVTEKTFLKTNECAFGNRA